MDSSISNYNKHSNTITISVNNNSDESINRPSNNNTSSINSINAKLSARDNQDSIINKTNNNKNVNNKVSTLRREFKSESSLIDSTLLSKNNVVSSMVNKEAGLRMNPDSNNTSFSQDVSNMSADEIQFQNKLTYFTMDDTLLNLTKKKSLKEYDEELKALKEENFSLKLRIYMLEEDISNNQINQQVFTGEPIKYGNESTTPPITTTTSNSDYQYNISTTTSSNDEADSNDNDRTLSDDSQSNSNTINPNYQAKLKKKPKNRKMNENVDLYDVDDDLEEKTREIENLNQLNLKLEQDIELLKSELNKKEKLIESNRKEYDNLSIKFEQFKLDCFNELSDQLNEKYQKELLENLDEANQHNFVREKELENNLIQMEVDIHNLKLSLSEKQNEIDRLRIDKVNSIRMFKNEAVNQIEDLMESLIEKDELINTSKSNNNNNNNNNISNTNSCIDDTISCSRNKDQNSSFELLDLNLSDHQLIESLTNDDSNNVSKKTITNTNISHDLVQSLKVHYQFIISDLENQLELKESLLQRFILIVQDKDKQINQLVNVGLLCNQNTNDKNIDYYIRELRKSLSDKDTLFEKTTKEHFDLVKQKEETIINLKHTLQQYISDLNKANEILLQSENRIDSLQNEIICLENSNKNLCYFIEQEGKKNREIMEDYRVESADKDEFITKMQNNIKLLKEKFSKKNDESSDLNQFYEQQLNLKDQTINNLNAKIEKLNNRILNTTESNDEEMNKMKKHLEDRITQLGKENNQLKIESSRLNLEYEKLESRFTQQVDEYEIEVEGLTNKLKEKENTIKNLIQSADEKDNLIVKLKSSLISSGALTEEDASTVSSSSTIIKDNNEILAENRDELRQRKIDGLLKLIQEKNNQIESLKNELNQQKQQNHKSNTSSSDLNSSYSSSTNNYQKPSSFTMSNSQSVKLLMQSLDREAEIYQKLNKNNDSTLNLRQMLNEVLNLRNQLLKATILKENHELIKQSSRRLSSSTDVLKVDNNSNSNNGQTILTYNKNHHLFSFLSPRSDWRRDSVPDSGLFSQKSDNTIESNNVKNSSESQTSSTSDDNQEHKVRPSKLRRTSSIPRPVNQNKQEVQQTKLISSPRRSLSISSISQNQNINYSLMQHDELVDLIQSVSNENMLLKRQLENRTPKVTELHKETSSLREQLASAKSLNDYLTKQIEIYHITHGNTEILIEMAQKLNLTKDELEQYKDKLSRIKDISDSLPTNRKITQPSKISEKTNNETIQDLPSRNIKITIATLETELENWKAKYRKLQKLHDNSERICRYLAIKFSKYTPILNHLGLFKSNNLKRSLSCPNLAKLNNNNNNGINQSSNLDDNQFKKLVNKLITENKSFEATSATSATSTKSSTSNGEPFDFINQQLKEKCKQLEIKLNEREQESKEYNQKLFYIYSGFKNLKANPKYLKQIFGETLMDSFKENLNSSESINNDNLILNIFSGAVIKFDEVNKKMEQKDRLIKELRLSLEIMNAHKENSLRASTSNRNQVHAIINENDFHKLKELYFENNVLLNDLNEDSNKIKDENLIKSLAKCQQDFGDLIKKFWVSDNSNRETIQDLELKEKCKKYKDEIIRLRDKIRIQNESIEQALEQLTNINKEKENHINLLSNLQIEEPAKHNRKKIQLSKEHENGQNIDDYLYEKLKKTHSNMKRARSNLQNKIDEQSNRM